MCISPPPLTPFPPVQMVYPAGTNNPPFPPLPPPPPRLRVTTSRATQFTHFSTKMQLWEQNTVQCPRCLLPFTGHYPSRAFASRRPSPLKIEKYTIEINNDKGKWVTMVFQIVLWSIYERIALGSHSWYDWNAINISYIYNSITRLFFNWLGIFLVNEYYVISVIASIFPYDYSWKISR